jgi:hypothetical protein
MAGGGGGGVQGPRHHRSHEPAEEGAAASPSLPPSLSFLSVRFKSPLTPFVIPRGVDVNTMLVLIAFWCSVLIIV